MSDAGAGQADYDVNVRRDVTGHCDDDDDDVEVGHWPVRDVITGGGGGH